MKMYYRTSDLRRRHEVTPENLLGWEVEVGGCFYSISENDIALTIRLLGEHRMSVRSLASNVVQLVMDTHQ